MSCRYCGGGKPTEKWCGSRSCLLAYRRRLKKRIQDAINKELKA